MKLLAPKTAIESILWTGLTVIFYVKDQDANEVSYMVTYQNTAPTCKRYVVDRLFNDTTVKFETISDVFRCILSEQSATEDSIEIEVTN